MISKKWLNYIIDFPRLNELKITTFFQAKSLENGVIIAYLLLTYA